MNRLEAIFIDMFGYKIPDWFRDAVCDRGRVGIVVAYVSKEFTHTGCQERVFSDEGAPFQRHSPNLECQGGHRAALQALR